MPKYTSRGNTYNIPEDKVNAFLSSRKDAVLIEDGSSNKSPVDKIDNGNIGKLGIKSHFPEKKTVLTPRESNIQDKSVQSASRNDLKEIRNIIKSVDYKSSPINTGIFGSDKEPKEVIQPFGKGQHLSNTVGQALQSMPLSTKDRFALDADTYLSEKEGMEQIRNNPNLSDEVKQQALDEFEKNTRTSNRTLDVEYLPQYAKEWLKSRETERKVQTPIRGNYGMSTQETVIRENTPEDIAFITDFVLNNPQGKEYFASETNQIKALENNISELKGRLKEYHTKADKEAKEQQGKPTLWNRLAFSGLDDGASTVSSNNNLTENQKLLQSTERQIEEQERLLEAVKDRGLNSLSQFSNEFGRRVGDTVVDAMSLGFDPALKSANDLTSFESISKKINAGQPLNEYESFLAEAAANNQAYLDLVGDKRTVSQDVARGINDSLPYMVNFMATGGIGKVATGAGKALLKEGIKQGTTTLMRSGVNAGTVKLGAKIAGFGLNVADAVGRASVMAAISPHTYRDMFDNQSGQVTYGYDRDGKAYYLGNKEQMDVAKAFGSALGSNIIENVSEFSGFGFARMGNSVSSFLKRTAPELGSVLSFGSTRNQFFQGVNKAMQTAGFNGTINEFLEEQVSTVLHSFFEDGQAQWSDLVDPRQQWITFLTVASIGSGPAILNTAGNQVMKYGVRKAYDNSFQDFGVAFINNDNSDIAGSFADVMRSPSSTIEDKQAALGDIVNSSLFNDKQKLAALNLYRAGLAYESYQGSKQTKIEEVQQNVAQQIEDNSNPNNGTVTTVRLANKEDEVNLISNVVLNEDGTIDRDKSSDILYYIDENGNRQMTSIDNIAEVLEQAPVTELIAEASNAVEQSMNLQFENEEAPVFEAGEVAIANIGGNQIQGVVAQATPDGYVFRTDDGMTFPVQPLQLTSIPGESIFSTTDEQNNASEESAAEPIEDIQPGIPFIEQIPQDEKGNLIFDQVPVETTIGALGEVYNEASELSGVVDATINNIQKQIDKAKSPKPTGDINKDIANKRASTQQLEELSKRLSYWEDVRSSIQQSQPIEQRVTEQLTGEPTVDSQQLSANNNKQNATNRKPTPFQRRLNAVEENVHSIRDRILFGIASGAYKFRWKDKGVSMGLARELGLSGSEAERKARIGLLSNNGYTPSTLAHRIWEETGGELNDNDIRSEVIDVLNSVSSRKQALETLENNAGITEEQYQQQESEASDYELELRAQEEALISEAMEQINEEDLLSLRDRVVELGATEQQLNEVFTSSDFIDLIEQLENGQESDTRPGNEQIEADNSEGNETDSAQRAVGERSRSEESTGDSRQDSDSTGNGINLSPEEQRVVNEATAEIDAEIAEAQKKLTSQQRELSSAIKRLGKAQTDTQVNLFGGEQQSKLFDVPADLSKENTVDNILSPIQQQINVAQTNLDNLTNSRDARIQEALENYQKQGNLLDEIARAEAETDTNPTEAQKEAGNYKKGKVTIQGFDISIEQPQGSVRSGVDENGKQWSVTMNNTYGYIRGTEGKDGDHIDVFLGDNPESNKVFVIDQVNPNTGQFDEHKVMLGFNSALSSKRAYLSNYEKGWKGLGNITAVDIETFRKWADSDTRRIKPFAEYKEIQQPESTTESSNDVRIVEYSDKSIAVYGNTKEIKDQLKAIGGRFNPKLRDGAGWIFPKSKESEVRTLMEEQSTTPVTSEVEVSTPAYGASNTLISTEEYEELRKRMRNKLNNVNVGFDPELFTIGTQMAMYHIEAGARKFADFANRMIEDLGDNVRPYLKSFYESARHAPGIEALSKEMDSFNEVNSYDLENLATFEEESNTSNNNNDETNRDNRSDNSIVDDGGIPTESIESDVRERTTSTQTDDREESIQRPAMETEDIEQRGRSIRSGRNNADTSGTELQTGRTDSNGNNRRENTGDTGQTNKPLNTNNNKQSREENVVPRGNTAKINANIAAIKLAKRLIETGKKATPEQTNVLRRYTGWGGLSSVFQTNDKNYKALQDLLTEEEYDSARASTTTAFYTPSEVTASVWDIIEKLGFKGGNILEPSAGIGNFFALMPESISNVSRLRGVELDTVSGSILKLLYPDANINISGFEKQRIANNSMDLVVSNVPFGNFKVYDSNNKDISTQFDIHDYFIAKSVRTLKAGGIGVFITTSSTLDKSSALRNWLINNGNADFIDAVRLNTDTFKNDAGTEATADIIIVRKRDVNGISPYSKNMQDSVMEREATYTQQEKNQWGYNTGEVEKKARMVYNKYFLDNPMRMAGEMKFGFEGGNAIRPTEQRLAPVKVINQQEVINRMIDELPSNIYNTTPADKASKAIANNGTKEGGLTIIDGQPYIVQYNEAVPVDWNSNKAAGYPKEEILQDYLDIKNTISELLEAESSTDNELVYINKTRTKLNKAYDNFVKKYGNLNENRKINFLQDDIDFPSVAAIENIEDGKDGVKTISKSDIFSKRVIDNQIEPKADNVEDAVRVSMNQNGKVDIPYIAQLLDRTNEEVQSEIVSKRIGFVNPETGLIESRNQYLSGNVRDKLSIAQQANQENEYDSNIEELSKVIPADIPINLIKLTLGSTWVPTNVYEDFFKETFDVGAQFTKTSTDKYIGKFSRKDNAKDIQMGMPEASGSTLALNSMNNATTTISMQVWEDGRRKTVTDPLKTAQAAAKQSEIAETFEAWVKQNKKYHEELENIYNNTFNAVVNSSVDVDSFDRFPGVGGKVVSIGSKLENGKELHQYRVAKENTEVDNELVAKEAKSLGLDYNAETGVYSTTNRGNADKFAKKLNGTAKILRQHQKEGVIRGLESATLLAHEVGTGKTLTLITTAMEMRRLGLAKKPTIVVQRSTYKQFVKEIKNQYPNAKVLAPSAKDLTAKQREQLFAKIAYNDWDIVVLYHSYLDSIPDNPQRVAQYIDEKIQEKMDLLAEMERAKEDGAANAGRMMGALKKEIERLERDRDNTLNPDIEEESDTPTKYKRKRSVKDIEKVRSNTEAKAEKSLDRRTDNTMTFEQLGIDALLIDEAHAYKKLGFVTSLQRVKGIDTAESKRAQSTRLKSSYILENHNGKNIVLATGTPISNTMAEMWTFMRYLYPRTEMGRLQMNNFDAFVNNFGSIEESAEFGSNGKFRITNRFSSYSNVPELIAAWRQVAHTVLTEEVSTLKEGVGTPRIEGGKPADIMLEQTAPLKSVMKAIKNKLEEFDRMSGAEKKENSYIPLVMFGLAKRAAIDVRLVDPSLPDHPDSKLNRTVTEVIQDLKDTQSYKGTIAIFCDSYQSSDKTFNVFRELKQKLVDSGIPAEQIAIINDFDKDEAKERLFASVNNGDVRVVLGTTEKLGVGVNIQERLHMAVHMDAPLRPSDYQQRNGRIMRQGNTHLNMDKTIKILRIGVQKTLDVTGYQRLEIKKKFIDQIMKGDVSQRMLEEADIESTDSSNFNQMMANLSGSQAALALSIEQNKLKKLQNARQYHEDNQVYMAGAVRRAKGIIVGNGQAIERFENYKKELNKLFPEGKVTTVSIGKVSANTPDDIDALLSKHITKRIDKEAADLREDFLRESTIIKTSMLVDGIKIDLDIEVKRNYDVQTNKTRVTREIHYTTPNNSIENPHSTKNEAIHLFDSKAGANVQNVIDEINDLLSGYDIEREIQRYKLGIDKAQRDIDAYEPQIGQPFAKESELRSTEEKVEDLNAQMEVELKQIEEAESKEDVEAIDIDSIVEKNTDDNPEDDPTPPSGGRRQTSSDNFQSIPAEKFDSLIDALYQTGLAVDVVIDEDIRNNPEIKDAQGNVYGYVTPDGVIHLDAQNMNANTPIHEFGHLWNDFVKKNNPELWVKGADLVKQSVYWLRVNENSAYKNLSEDTKVDEALSMAIGDKGEAVWNSQQDLSLYVKIKSWLYDVWNSIKKALGIKNNVSIEDMTLEGFTDLAVSELLGGKNLVDKNKNNNFEKNNNRNDKRGTQEATASGLDNRRTMAGSAIREALVEPETRSGIHRTVEAINTAGGVSTVRDAEEREELEARGIDPDFDKSLFREELREEAKQNGVWLDSSFLDGKTLLHDQKIRGTSENDVYLNIDGTTLTKLNNLSYVKGIERDRNMSAVIDRLAAHNDIFPNVPYTIKGFMDNKNGFPSLVIEQPYINNVVGNATQEEIDEYLTNIGFNKDGIREWSNGHKVWGNGKYELFDARPANVLKGKDGNLYFIDTIPHSVEYMNRSESEQIRFQSINSPELNVEYDGDLETFVDAQVEASRLEREYKSKLDLGIAAGKARRAFVDQYQPLELLQKTVEKKIGKKISEFENAYMSSQMVQSLDGVQIDIWNKDYMGPIYESIKDITLDENISVTESDLMDYMKVKHGIHRNERLRTRNEKEDGDFSGIYSILERYEYEPTDEGAGQFVKDFENKIDKELINNLWDSIKSATNHILQTSYDAGMIDKKTFIEMTTREDFYIPLRGWNEGTMAELYEYMGNKSIGETFQSVMKTAEGRQSESDNPIAFIKMLGESEIMRANKNRMKQALLNMVRNHKFPALYTVDKMYEVLSYDPVTNKDVWVEVNYRPDAELLEGGGAREVKSGHKFDKPITPYQIKEHHVVVYELGEKYIITFTNPSVSQSVNGMLNQSVKDSTWLSWASGINRFMSAAYTKWNPEFFLYTNFARDFGQANMMHLANNGGKYTLEFNRNIPIAMKAYWRAMFGSPDMNNPVDKSLKEFIDNGGETGFAVLKDLEKTKRDIEHAMSGKKTLYDKFEDSKVIQLLEKMGRITEGATRFATYMTSISEGRTVKQSIVDAKNVTVNFNKKGSGETIKFSDLNIPILSKMPFFKDMPISARFFQIGYVFFNASIQGVDVVIQTSKRNKKAMAVIAASFYAAGVGLSMLCRLLMGDDDETGMSEYDKIPDFVRQNNLIIPTGKKNYISIPLPQILRGFYGLGEMSASYYSGMMKGKNIGVEMIGAMTDDLSPVDLGSIIRKKNDRWYVSGSVPTMVKPIAEVLENVDYLGRDISKQNQYNDHLPEYRRVFNRTGLQWIGLSQILNDATGGDSVQKGIVNINPAKIEHLMQNYFGGLIKFSDKSLSRIYDVAKMIEGNDINIDSRDIPLIGKIIGQSSDRVGMSNYANRYYEYLRNAETFNKQTNEYLKIMDYDGYMKLLERNNFEAYNIIETYNKAIKKMKKAESSIPDGDTHPKVSDTMIIDAVTKYEQLNNITR